MFLFFLLFQTLFKDKNRVSYFKMGNDINNFEIIDNNNLTSEILFIKKDSQVFSVEKCLT